MIAQRFEHLPEEQMRPGNLWACNRCGAVVWLQRIEEHKLICWAGKVTDAAGHALGTGHTAGSSPALAPDLPEGTETP